MTGMDGARPAAGWYPDPWGTAPLRWWDGEAWAAAVSQHGADAPPPPRPPPEGPPSIDARATGMAIGAYFAAGVLAAVVFILVRGVTDEAAVVLIAAQGALYGTMLMACARAVTRYGTGSWRRDLGFGVQLPDVLTGLGTFLVGGIVANLVASAVASDPDLQGSSTDTLLEADASWPFLVTVVFVVVVAAPIVEELFFRGLLLRALASRLPPLPANLVQGTLFALAHVDPSLGWRNLDTVLRVGVLGLAFGYIAQERRRLGPGMVAHAVTNTIAVVVNLAVLQS